MTAFSQFDPFEQRISAALDEIAAPRRPDYLDDIFRLTAGTSQRPRWTFLERWLPMDTTLARSGRLERLPIRPVMLLVLLALLVAAIGFGFVASMALLHRVSLTGVLQPTGAPTSSLFQPAAAVLRDGKVLVVGATPDLRLDAELYDPASGRFEPLAGVAPRRFNQGSASIGVVPLVDGGALIVLEYASSQSGEEYGGYALRLDPDATGLRSTGGWAAGATPPGDLARFEFTRWPSALLADGRVRWTSPSPWLADPSVVYSPADDSFTVEVGALPVDPTGPAVALALPDGRYLSFQGGSDGQTVVAVNLMTGSEQPMGWPLVAGGGYSGTRLPDGRILILGKTMHIFDPRSGKLSDLTVPADLDFRLWLPDGRMLLTGVGEDQGLLGATPTTQAWVLDPSTTSLVRLAPNLPIPSSTFVLLDNDRVLVVAGDAGEPAAWIMR